MRAFGYSENEQGERVIPASRRADGSLRPERRVREGYVPQEMQPLYQSRAALERRGVPLCPGIRPSTSLPTSSPGAEFVETKTTTKSAKKNEKRKQRKKATVDPVDAVTNQVIGNEGPILRRLGGECDRE